MVTVGIIGFGSFGRFLAEKLDAYCRLRVYSRSGKPNKWAADLAEVSRADYLILSIPLEGYAEMLKKLKPLLKSTTIIVDVCSVKEEPIQIIRSILPGQKVVATHPLFGPESAADTVRGHTLVLCPDVSDARGLQLIERLAANFGLEVKKMSAREHDREMATVQGLTFFIAHILKECGIHDLQLSTPSFKRLLSLAELEKQHSDELFYTIQAGNPHTIEVRKKFINRAEKLNQAIAEHQKELLTDH